MGRNYTNKSPTILLVLIVVTTVARSAWVGDYASNHGCGETVAAELCDPGDSAANHACSDACHYNGCRGGMCVEADGGGGRGARGCYCRR
uniref:Knottin scorpion toxin-like domain-containing protein n=1 Tax=Leersia perrieri TaxID=77586 RepID=A0A0D9VNK8_9ORYZ